MNALLTVDIEREDVDVRVLGSEVFEVSSCRWVACSSESDVLLVRCSVLLDELEADASTSACDEDVERRGLRLRDGHRARKSSSHREKGSEEREEERNEGMRKLDGAEEEWEARE